MGDDITQGGSSMDPTDAAYDAAIDAIKEHWLSDLPRWVIVVAVNAAFDARAADSTVEMHPLPEAAKERLRGPNPPRMIFNRDDVLPVTPPREGGDECDNTLTEPHWPIITCIREPQHPGLHGGWYDDEWFNWSDDYGIAP